MHYLSASSRTTNPYRAGLEIGEQLAAIRPELVLVFCSINYGDQLSEVVAALRESLGEQVLICGGTGDGIIETTQVAHHGICALGISSAGTVQWQAALVAGVGADSRAAAVEASRQALTRLNMPPTLAFILATGTSADGSLLVEGVREVLTIPVFGGLSADDRQFARSMVFLGDQVSQDCVLVLVAGGSIDFRLNAASGWAPTGKAGVVTSATGNTISRIDQQTAAAFVHDQVGATLGTADLGVIPLAAFCSPEDTTYYLRTPSATNPATGEMTLFGQIPTGSRVRVCTSTLAEIIGGVDAAVNPLTGTTFVPGCAIVISCAGRKWLLPESGREELQRLTELLGNIPLVGFPSFGEIGPFRQADGSYTAPHFHNVTFVVCLLGS
jgi:hypothetical protein